eukprot:649670-Heterocapsa_arctica.AAC.1
MEKDSQKDYETMMGDAVSKRAPDAKSITEKEGAKANTEDSLEQEKDKHISPRLRSSWSRSITVSTCATQEGYIDET